MPFPPIYILSLKAAQRFGPLVRMLEARGLDYEIVWGVDGRERLPATHEHCVDRAGAEARMGRPMSDGEFACALSHRLIYERIAAGEAPSAIVLEDDAEPGEAFFDLGAALVAPPCGLLLFDHKNTYVRVRDRLVLPGGVCAFRMALPPFLATGYMVSREVAAHLAFRDGPVVQPSDWPDAILQFDSYACDPRVVTQRGKAACPSSLEAGRQRHRHRRRKSLRRLLYRSYWRRWMTKRLAHKLA
ncbi:glycosyltransferase family 25 protein [Marivita sp. GX14005]|uniref:glycosyltransferase family 25 protein n=1 Tax=Marivita sp. GX14005 TaxID=2942276 RepID=UPI002018FE07|nr:glycosyltransferase family 25 protein [Marivita sp. GX14005]MCL3883968.1 glycosyltransferase family 25 protein [Marivita sp. GX14005]